MLIVQKYGGSSVADTECIQRVARRITDAYSKGNKIVVVLSAQGDTTDDLYAKAKALNDKASRRELDMLVTTGEQQSVALMAMAIHKLGYPAISLTAGQVGIHATSTYGNARIKNINTSRISAELDRNNIVLVAGFQGLNRYGDVTTLGRGASDTTAVALAAVLHADLCEIYTDVAGVYTADPRVVKNAKKIDEISYEEMLELASLGAQVLHNRAVEMAKRHRVRLVVRSSWTAEEGTLVKEEVPGMEKLYVSGIAVDDKIARLSVVGIEDRPGMAYQIFSLLAKEKISVDIILQSIGRNASKDISFTVHIDSLQKAMEALEQHRDSIGFDMLSYDDDVAKLSIVGAGMASNSGVAAMMFEALYDNGVNINMISTSEIKISVLIDKKYIEKAMMAVHDKFIGNPMDNYKGGHLS
ncbi:MAG: aspartate kinase [Defluviitaleaceae bacterium]|nr:aspartate kinase [Defluviitaleaceae bacterium]